MKRFFKALPALLLALLLAVPVQAAGPAQSDVYYEQLSETAQRLYDALDDPANLDCFYSGEGIVIELALDGEDFHASAQRIFQANSYAFSAFELNHPELFWLAGDRETMNWNGYEMIMTITPTFAWNWDVDGRSVHDDAAAVADAVTMLAEEARAQGDDPYAQLLYVHDWLTQHNCYNTAAASAPGDDYLPWTPLSALTDVSQPVCEGYSKAFKLVCDELGIPCVTVDGYARGGHMWNQVLLYGNWYAVDVTWDDPVTVSADLRSGREMQIWFLVGSGTQPRGETQTFSQSHIPDGSRLSGTSFDFPALSPTAYDPDAPHTPDEPDEPTPTVFEDVPDGAYYSEAVRWAVGQGVTNGTSSDPPLFSPDTAVTREQAVTFLWRAVGCPEPVTAENPFSDVKDMGWNIKAILWAVENGITNGMRWDEENGVYEFSPGKSVTRGQMLTFLWRAVGKPGYEGEGLGGYADAEAWAFASGVPGGIADSYATADACPRCDVVYYLFNAVGMGSMAK